MHESPQRPARRSIRLKHFDYSQPGAYFLTICAHNHSCLFGSIVWGEMGLNDCGELIHRCWLEIPHHFPHVELAAHVVMPNHLHGILVLRERARRAVPLRADMAGSEMFAAPVRGSIPTIVRSFKSATSKRIRQALKSPAIQVWRPNYYEHCIRNQDDFEKTSEYIRLNPARWDFDPDNPQRCTTASHSP